MCSVFSRFDELNICLNLPGVFRRAFSSASVPLAGPGSAVDESTLLFLPPPKLSRLANDDEVVVAELELALLASLAISLY